MWESLAQTTEVRGASRKAINPKIPILALFNPMKAANPHSEIRVLKKPTPQHSRITEARQFDEIEREENA
jgi:hypothetical protein